MANAFTLTSNIDYKKLNSLQGTDEIYIGFPSGIPHASGNDNVDEIAKKLSFGAGPQSWTTNKMRATGEYTKSGRPKMKRTLLHHSVEGIPARPFLEEGMLDGINEINSQIEKYYKKKIEGDNSPTGLHAVAVTCIGAIQKFVRGDYYKSTKPNSHRTIVAKESDTPLIDTGQMINSLTYIVDNQSFAKAKNEETGKKEWSTK